MNNNTIHITRLFSHPAQTVFNAFRDPVHISNWWGPIGFTTTTHQMEFQEGGTWEYTMHGPDGVDYPNHVVYTKIDEPVAIYYDHGDGQSIHFRVEIDLRPLDNQTELTMCLYFPTPEERDKVIREHGAEEGLAQTIGRLMEFLNEQH